MGSESKGQRCFEYTSTRLVGTFTLSWPMMTYLEAYSPQDKRNEYNKSLVNVSSHKKTETTEWRWENNMILEKIKIAIMGHVYYSKKFERLINKQIKRGKDVWTHRVPLWSCNSVGCCRKTGLINKPNVPKRMAYNILDTLKTSTLNEKESLICLDKLSKIDILLLDLTNFPKKTSFSHQNMIAAR